MGVFEGGAKARSAIALELPYEPKPKPFLTTATAEKLRPGNVIFGPEGEALTVAGVEELTEGTWVVTADARPGTPGERGRWMLYVGEEA